MYKILDEFNSKCISSIYKYQNTSFIPAKVIL